MQPPAIPTRPRLRGYLRQLQLADDVLTLRGGATSVTFRGRSVTDLLPDLLPRLDGARTVADLADDLPHVSEDVIRQALQVLADQQLLEDANAAAVAAEQPVQLRSQADFWASLGADPHTVQARLADAAVLVIADGELGRALVEALSQSGIGQLRLTPSLAVASEPSSADTGPGAPGPVDALAGVDLAVLCSDATDLAAHRAVNEAAHAGRVPWLSVSLGSNHATVGPFVFPGITACYECFRLRLAANQSFLDDALGRSPIAQQDQPPVSGLALPAFFPALVGHTAAAEVIRHVSGTARPSTAGAFLSLRPLSAAVGRHEVLRLPRCPVCGPQRYRPQSKIWDLPTGRTEGEAR